MQQTIGALLDLGAILAVRREQFRHALAQGVTQPRVEGDEIVERFACGSARRRQGIAAKKLGVEGRADVQDAVADGDAAAWPTLAARTEDAERQVLDGEVGMAVRTADPALALW